MLSPVFPKWPKEQEESFSQKETPTVKQMKLVSVWKNIKHCLTSSVLKVQLYLLFNLHSLTVILKPQPQNPISKQFKLQFYNLKILHHENIPVWSRNVTWRMSQTEKCLFFPPNWNSISLCLLVTAVFAVVLEQDARGSSKSCCQDHTHRRRRLQCRTHSQCREKQMKHTNTNQNLTSEEALCVCKMLAHADVCLFCVGQAATLTGETPDCRNFKKFTVLICLQNRWSD